MPNPALIVVILAAVLAPAITYVRTKDKRKTLIAFLAVVAVWVLLGVVDMFFVE